MRSSMNPEHRWQLYGLDRKPLRSRRFIASAVLCGIAAAAWVWVLVADVWLDSTPAGYVTFGALVGAVPFFAALAIDRVYSVLIGPAALMIGAWSASFFMNGPVWSGELPAGFIWLVYSGMMLIPWGAGHVLIGVLTAKRRIPKDV